MADTIREAYGKALLKYGKEDTRVVVLDADVSGSTKSRIFGAEVPERFFNVGIAEANMTAMAAGLASVGKIPFVNTFAAFMDSICLLPARTFGSYSHLGLKLAGAYGGLSDSFDGPTHHSVDDLAVMRALPNFEVYVASDAVLTDWMVKNAIDHLETPMYLRLSRETMPDFYPEGEEFVPGRGKVLREGTDLAIIACGSMTGAAMEAADILARQGIDVRVIDMFCLKPLDTELVLASAEKCGRILTAEEHSIIGGLGSAVCEALCRSGRPVPVGMVGLDDTHAECGPYSEIKKKYHIDVTDIVNAAIRLV